MPNVGRNRLLAIPLLERVGTSSNIATDVVSLPVPAVVGMAINGVRNDCGGMDIPLPNGGLTYS